MIDILNCWPHAVMYHSETARTIAESVLAAYKNGADLSGADLRGADLSGAKGLLSKEIIPLQIIGTKHAFLVREDGHITIGCEHHPTAWWEEHYRAVGRRECYTDAQINEYRNFIAVAKYWMKLYGVDQPKTTEAR